MNSGKNGHKDHNYFFKSFKSKVKRGRQVSTGSGGSGWHAEVSRARKTLEKITTANTELALAA